jgi:hypothetical protein
VGFGRHVTSKAWIRSPAFDLLWISGPGIFSVLFVLALQARGVDLGAVSPWSWLLLIVGVDVAHVYSTVFRTYLHPETRKRRNALLWAIPVACWMVGMLLYTWGAEVFWRALAYLAVFHFIRQQYGFLRIYSRKESSVGWKRLDATLLTASTVLPLLHWHVEGREYAWFVAGDFIGLPDVFPMRLFWVGYAVLWCVYLWRATRVFNLPKTALLASTALSWILGIVVWKGDLAFTLTNVIAHGIPYLALVWHAQERETQSRGLRFAAVSVAALLALVVFAYFEEGLWDAWVWGDRPQLFPWTDGWLPVKDSALLACLVPLLALPQAVHYVLDGFIWRAKDRPLG